MQTEREREHIHACIMGPYDERGYNKIETMEIHPMGYLGFG